MAEAPISIEYPAGSGSFHALNDADHHSVFPLEAGDSEQGQPIIQASLNAPGLPIGSNVAVRQSTIWIVRTKNAAKSQTDWYEDIRKWFSPAHNRFGPRVFRKTARGGATVESPVFVLAIDLLPDATDAYTITLGIPGGVYVATSESQTTGNPSNAGNLDAQTRIVFSTAAVTTNVWRFTFTDNTGDGIYKQPWRVDVSATIASDTWVLLNGTPIPFTYETGGDDIYFPLSIPAGGTATLDIIEDTNVVNPHFDTYPIANFPTAASWSNSSPRWNNWDLDINDGGYAFQWKRSYSPQPFVDDGTGDAFSDYSFGLTDGGNVVTTLHQPASSSDANDANGGILFCTGQVTNLTNFSRQTANHTSGVRSFVEYKKRAGASVGFGGSSGRPGEGTGTDDNAGWIRAWEQTGNATVTTTIDVTDAEFIRWGMEPTSNAPTDGATLTIDNASTFAQLATTNGPSQSGGSITARRLDGTLTNTATGQSLTFDDFIFPGTSLEVNFAQDLEDRGVFPGAENGPVWGSFEPSDPENGITLVPGSNTLSGLARTVHWKNTYS